MSWVFKQPKLVVGIGGVTATGATALGYLTAFVPPVGLATVGVLSVGAFVAACVYAKKKAVITWATPVAVDWQPGIRALQYQTAVLNHAETAIGYTLEIGRADADLDAGTYTMVARARETANYHAADDVRISFTIRKIRPVVQWSADPVALTYPARIPGGALNATVGAAPGVITYTVAPGDVLRPGNRTLVATYTATGPNHENNTAARPLVVALGRLTITWPEAAAIDYGETTIFDATASVPGGRFTYRHKHQVLDGSTLDLQVRDTPYPVTVTYRLDGYEEATRTRQVTVRRAQMQITWAAPAAIEHGVALGDAQLNASSNAHCAPPQYTDVTHGGTGIQRRSQLSGGLRTLEVRFTTQNANYHSPATKRVQIQVDPARPVITWNPPATISDGRVVDPLYADAVARNPHTNAIAPGTFGLHAPVIGTQTVLGAPLAVSLTFTPANAADHLRVVTSRDVQVVRVTAAEKLVAGISAQTEAKILVGTIEPGDRLIGAHSPRMLADAASFQLVPDGPPRADGTRAYTVRKRLPGGGWSLAKTSTLPPLVWSDDDIMRATVDTAAVPSNAIRPHDGATRHQLVLNGVEWTVLKEGGQVTMSTPTGGGFPFP